MQEDEGIETMTEAWYPSTANPQNHRNIELHCNRFRETETPDADYFEALYQDKEWRRDHIHLDEMPVSRFVMPQAVQRILYSLQQTLVDHPYEAFGKTEGSWDGYTLMFRNGWSVGDKRKPVTDEFQEFCETVYRPILFQLLFGQGWETIKEHWGTFKSCTIKVCEGDQNFLGQQVFHMHIDGKIGLRQKKNHAQRHMSRLLFSIVTPTLEEGVDARDLQFGTTVYPIWQPPLGFKSNHAFHKYMQSKYRECGLKNSGLPRPHYEMPEELVYRAISGEVLFHFTHSDETSGPQAIHAEPNPCPDRHLYVFDWNNIVRKEEGGKYLPSIEVPEEEIIDHMRVLSQYGTEELAQRLESVIKKARELQETASKYPGGTAIIEEAVATLRSLIDSF